MIEQAIYFALGCIITALGALMFAPIFWSRALRLTRKRLQLQIPVSMQEIYAERDAMRAEFAVERLRVEQDLERVRAGKAADMAEIGRRSMDATRLGDEMAALRDELWKARGELAGVQASLAEAQHDRDGRDAEITRLNGELARAGEQLPAATSTNAGDAERLIEAGAAQARAQVLEDELAAAREREKSLHLQNSLKAEKGRSADRALADRLDRLQSENAALQAALDEALGGSRHLASPDDAGLRESIHALGLAVAAMTREAGPAPVETLAGERDEAATLN